MHLLSMFTMAATLSISSWALSADALVSDTTSSSTGINDNLAAVTLPPSAPPCTTQQQEAYDATRNPFKELECNVLRVGYFQSCDDNCLALYQHQADTAPSCTQSSLKPWKESADLDLKNCQEVRANTTGKYIPKLAAPGTANCTDKQLSDWKSSFGNAADVCADTTRTTRNCSDDCLKVIETSVDQAPMCTKTAYTYTLRESAKAYLINCLQTRGDDLKTNIVLQGDISSNNNGSSSSSNNSGQTTVPPDAKSTAVSGSPFATILAITTGAIALLFVAA